MKKTVSGLRAWLVQRFTALYLLAFLLFLLFHFAFASPDSYESWRAWVAGPFISNATALCFLSLFLHAWVGLRDVAMDYVHPLPLRVAVLAMLALLLSGLGMWAWRIVLSA